MIQKVHYLVKQKWNKLDSNSNMDLTSAMIDMTINQVSRNYINYFFNSDGTLKRVGLEGTQYNIDEIANLVISKPEQPSLTPIDRGEGIYEVPFSYLTYKYFHLLRASTNTDCGVVSVDILPHSKLSQSLNDYYRKPKKAWRRALAKIAKSSNGDGISLYVYTNGDFVIDTIDIEYIKEPKDVFFGGYDSIETVYGKEGYTASDDPVDPEIRNLDLLADMVVQELLTSVSNDYNMRKDNMMSKT